MAIRSDADGDKFTRTTSLPATNAFTICAFAYVSQRDIRWNSPFSLHASTSAYIYPFFNDTNDLRIEHPTPGASAVFHVIKVGEWFFCAVTGDGTNFTGYGGSVGAPLSSATPAYSGFTPTALVVNDNAWTGEWFNGRIAGMRVWDAALSATELLAESKQLAPVRSTNLNGFYPFFDDIVGTDQSGNGRHFTDAGTPTQESNPPVPWSAFHPYGLSGGRRIRVPNGMSRSWSN